MSITATAITSADAERYQEAERILWDHYGLEPTEHLVEISSPTATLREVEVGSGPPLLLFPGTAGTGPYRTAGADLLRGVLDALEIDRADVVGASIGDVGTRADGGAR